MPEDSKNESTLKENGKNEPEQDLFTWVAPARPFKKRNREFYITTIAIAAVVGFVLFLAEGALPVILIASLVFLFYVMSTVPPDNIEYKITSRGIRFGDKRTDWDKMGRFWFSRRFDNELLIVELFVLPGRLEMVVNTSDKESIQKEISHYLSHEEIPPSFFDKAALWFSKKLPQ